MSPLLCNSSIKAPLARGVKSEIRNRFIAKQVYTYKEFALVYNATHVNTVCLRGNKQETIELLQKRHVFKKYKSTENLQINKYNKNMTRY